MTTINERLKQKKFKNNGQAAFLSILTAAAHLKEEFGKVCAKESISIQQYNILRILMGVYPDGYPRCDITDRMIEKAPDTTRLIDRLLKQDLVIREKCEDDKRQSITKISEKGIKLVKKMNTKVDQFEAHFEKEIGTDTCLEFIKINERVLNL